jgi:hypothetical protein
MPFTYKTLGQSDPVAATLTDLYTVPPSTSAIVAGVTICNRSAVPTSVRIAVSVGGGAVANKDYLCYDMPIPANATVTLQPGATLAATDKLRCYATLATISFNAFGVEITP